MATPLDLSAGQAAWFASPAVESSRIWVDDRHPIFRRGLSSCLGEEGFAVVAETAGLRPPPDAGSADILVFEADAGSLQRVPEVARSHRVALVAMVGTATEHLVADAVAAGVAAVLVRGDLTPARLVMALRAVASGATALPSALVPGVLDRIAHIGRSGPHALATRELAVLQLLSAGDDTRAIGDSLGYSERTVKNIVHDVLMKMNCRNRVHAVAQATRLGII